MYRMSKCVHIVKNNEIVVAFNDYNFKVIDLDKDLYSVVERIEGIEESIVENTEELRYLLDNKFLVKKDEDELEKRQQKREFIRQRIMKEGVTSKIGYLRISLTEQCNLRCKYCFVNDIVDKSSNITEELFCKAVEMLIQNSRNPRIQYFGGEPLLRMELIELGHEILNAAKKKGQIDSFIEEIVTNGTLLTKDKIDFFVNNEMGLIFSVDGWKEIHDKNRVDIYGKGSFNTVIEKFQAFIESGGKAEIIITPNKDNIELLDQITQFFVETYDLKKVSINAPQPNEKGWDIDGKTLAEKIINIYLYCEKHDILLSAPGMNLVQNLLKKRYQIFSCVNYGTLKHRKWGMYLLGTGKISYCNVECSENSEEWFNNFNIGRKIDQWHMKNNYSEECLTCLAYSVCGGPCGMEREMIKNVEIMHNKCAFNKKIVEWALTR